MGSGDAGPIAYLWWNTSFPPITLAVVTLILRATAWRLEGINTIGSARAMAIIIDRNASSETFFLSDRTTAVNVVMVALDTVTRTGTRIGSARIPIITSRSMRAAYRRITTVQGARIRIRTINRNIRD